ncbi:MAG: WhiB family transcriptional regulator [Pseudonocardia sp.]
MIRAFLPDFLAQLAPGQRTPCHGRGDLFTNARRAPTAKALCTLCPIQTACAEYAIRTGQPTGVWGGLTPKERRARVRPACGTEEGWRSHVARGESCHTCREAHDTRLRAGRLVRLEAEHAKGGTVAGYRLELLLGLPTCSRCRSARAAYYQGRPRTRKWYRRAAA